MTDILPKDLLNVVATYVDGDITPDLSKRPATLFAKNLEVMWAAKNILKGSENEVKQVIALVKKKPELLRVKVEATDPLGRRVKGTLLQIAAMAGDVNLHPRIQCEKDQGIVERLIAAGNLSPEEIRKQLECMTSEEAKKVNEERNQRIFLAIQSFIQNLIDRPFYNDTSLDEYIIYHKDLIDKFEEDLKDNTKQVITMGNIFDFQILYEAMRYFKDLKDFYGLKPVQNDVFCIHVLGKLQSRLSARDAQIIKDGMGNFPENHVLVGPLGFYTNILGNEMPSRCLNNTFGSSHFYHDQSKLGIEYYLTYWGILRYGSPTIAHDLANVDEYQTIVVNKQNSIEKCLHTKQSRCALM